MTTQWSKHVVIVYHTLSAIIKFVVLTYLQSYILQRQKTHFRCQKIHKTKYHVFQSCNSKAAEGGTEQGNWQYDDGQYMEREILTDSGQTVQCEVLTDSGQTVQCEVLTDSGQTVQCEVLTDSRQTVQCEVLTDSRQTVQCKVLTDSGQTVQCEVLTDSGQTVQCEVLTDIGQTVQCAMPCLFQDCTEKCMIRR